MLLRDENSGFLHFTCPLVGPKSYELGSTIPLGVSVRGASTKNKLKNITLRCLTENFETTFIERSVKNPIWEGAPFRWGTFVAPVRARPTYTPAHVLIVIWDRRPYGPVQACQEMWRSWAHRLMWPYRTNSYRPHEQHCICMAYFIEMVGFVAF